MALRLRRICPLNTRSDALTTHLIKIGYTYSFIKEETEKVLFRSPFPNYFISLAFEKTVDQRE